MPRNWTPSRLPAEPLAAVRHRARGRFATVNLATADRWCLALGEHLDTVY